MDEKLTEHDKKVRMNLVILAAILLIVVSFGFIYLTTTAADTLTLMLSFAGGISNIVLPCTLPLVFIIVPIAMSTKPKKGLIMTALFGLGLIITLSVYGAVIAEAGAFLGLDNATRIMYSIAGVASIVFGLSELKLITFKMPSYFGNSKIYAKQK